MMSSALSDSELLQPRRIGTFLRYAMANAHNLVLDENVQIMSQNLRQFLRLGKIDLLLLTKMFVLNDFQNLELEERFNIDNEYFELHGMKDCIKKLLKLNTDVMNMDHLDNLYRQPKKLFIRPSPCFNISNYTECQDYCKWTDDVLKNWTTKQIIDILKYKKHFRFFG